MARLLGFPARQRIRTGPSRRPLIYVAPPPPGSGGIVQQASGLFAAAYGNDAAFTVTLPAPATGRVLIIVAGNTTIATPAGFSARAFQANALGHYLFDAAGASGTSWVVTTGGTGQGTWYVAEIENGVYDGSAIQDDVNPATTYTTPALTPAAGNRIVIASIASMSASAAARTVDSWTNGFTEVADLCEASWNYSMQGVAALAPFVASGSTAYSTGATYSATSTARSGLIAAYATSGSGFDPRRGSAQLGFY